MKMPLSLLDIESGAYFKRSPVTIISYIRQFRRNTTYSCTLHVLIG